MTWFDDLTGVSEESPDFVRQHLSVDGDQLKCVSNGRAWRYGSLETPSLAELRSRVTDFSSSTKVREVVANVQELHCDPSNAGAMFQVASQFNLLEMAHPDVTPEEGVGMFQHDLTQGPACAIAAGAGTIYRNYFAPINGSLGQTKDNQIDCLRDIGDRLGNTNNRLWDMVNGYAIPSREGLEEVHSRLTAADEAELEELRNLLRIGIQRNTQVTLLDANHSVSQCFCSALPVAYTGHSSAAWAPFATLILEAAYEATLCASIENAKTTGNNKLYLTLLGGGAFGNMLPWILNAISRAISLHPNSGLDVAIVSYGRSSPEVRELADELNSKIRDRTQ